MASVNTASSSRAQRAQQTRQRMLDSARELFVSEGYADTPMTRVAEHAGVAVQTLYYSFQTKGKLLIEVVESVAAGGESVPVPRRAWFQEMMSSSDAQRLLALLVEHGTAIYERVAELWPAVTAAMSDHDVADYWERVTAGRHDAQRGQVARIAELGGLKPELTVERGTDLIVFLAGHAPYRSFVEDAGWSMVEYKAWLFRTLVEQLLDGAVDPKAAAGLSFAKKLRSRKPRKKR